MRDSTFSWLCANAKADAACALLSGGRLLLYDGERPKSVGESVDGQRLLVALRFGTPAFALAREGVAESLRLRPAPGLLSGRPTWFRAATKLDEAVFDGTCGYLRAGESYDLYLDAEVEADGEVRVARLAYVEPL